MARRMLRAVKVCAHCGSGFDAFRAMESRGRFCSPQCLAGARLARQSRGTQSDEATPGALHIEERGPAMIPRLTAAPDAGAADSAIA